MHLSDVAMYEQTVVISRTRSPEEMLIGMEIIEYRMESSLTDSRLPNWCPLGMYNRTGQCRWSSRN